jgi:hypothetical protein
MPIPFYTKGLQKKRSETTQISNTIPAMKGVPVPDKEKYDLPPGYPTVANPHIEAYSASFIHQFHCLVRPRPRTSLFPPSFSFTLPTTTL